MDIVGMLKFVESYCFDEQLYMVLPISKGGEEELVWRRGEPSRPWAIRARYEGASWWRYEAEKLPAALERRGISLEALENELRATVQLHATQAQLMLREARNLIGADTVDGALESFDAFTVELGGAVREILDLPEPVLDTHVERVARGHLRLLVRD